MNAALAAEVSLSFGEGTFHHSSDPRLIRRESGIALP
jgi:hypothetical protein